MDRPEAYKGTEPYIFISYKHNDKQMKEGEIFHFVSRLQQDGYRVWYDQGIEPGTHFDEEIASRVEGCQFFLCFLSEEYFKSNWCSTELDNAFELNKTIVPIYLKSDISVPKGKSFKLRSWHAIYKKPSDGLSDLVREIYRTRGIEQCCVGGAVAKEQSEATPTEVRNNVNYLSDEQKKQANFLDKKYIKWALAAGALLVCLLIAGVLFGKGKEDAAPAGTEVSKTTDAPDATDAPKSTDAPDATDAPKSTDAPEATDAPKSTDASEPTDAPEPTEAPETGTFSGKYLSEMTVDESNFFSFSTFKQTDTVGNEYRGDNIALLSMNGKKSGYATYNVGGEYQYLSGIVAVNDTSVVKRFGVLNVYVATDDSEWEQVYQSTELYRGVAPIKVEVDISGADWVYIEYIRTDKYGSNTQESSLILVDFAFSKEQRETVEISKPDYGDNVSISDIKVAEGEAYSFVTMKQKDTVGNEYFGDNILKLEMNDDISGHVNYYVGSAYQYLSGFVTPSDSNNPVRRGVFKVYTQVNGGEWNLAYESPEIDRTMAPFEVKADISGADWVWIEFVRTDSYIYLEDMAGVFLVDFVLTKSDAKEIELPVMDYGDEVLLSKVKVTEGSAYSYVTVKETDTVGNEYTEDDVLLFEMNNDVNAYAIYYVGAGYQRLTGTVAVSDISHEKRRGAIEVYAKKNGGAWDLRYRSDEINRSTEPFALDVDISGADWVSVEFVRKDSSVYLDDIARVIFADGVLTKDGQ